MNAGSTKSCCSPSDSAGAAAKHGRQPLSSRSCSKTSTETAVWFNLFVRLGSATGYHCQTHRTPNVSSPKDLDRAAQASGLTIRALSRTREVSHGAGADDLNNLGNERPNEGDDSIPPGTRGQADRH